VGASLVRGDDVAGFGTVLAVAALAVTGLPVAALPVAKVAVTGLATVTLSAVSVAAGGALHCFLATGVAAVCEAGVAAAPEPIQCTIMIIHIHMHTLLNRHEHVAHTSNTSLSVVKINLLVRQTTLHCFL
jgi:hypothetical protein